MKKLMVVILLLVGLAVAIAVATVYFSGGSRGGLAGNAVLRLTLDQPLSDYDPAPQLPFFGSRGDSSLIDIYRALSGAQTDPDVLGLAVHIKRAAFGLAQAEELRRQIAGMAAAGKTVECYLETAGEGSNGTLAYYVASACPRITLAPAGELNIVGLLADSSFFRGALDKLKIEPEFQSVGTYKSAGEAYTEYQHSEPAREALSSLLDDFYSLLATDIAAGRQIEASRVRELIDRAPYAAAEALELGLVDRLAYPDQFDTSLHETLGDDWDWVNVEDYVVPGIDLGRSKVAIAFAQGTIVRGRSGVDPWSQARYIGSDGFGGVLDELIEDDSIVAVILRVDSPGGSAQASDLLLRQVERLAEAKPVVVSMSSVAASGGYYISAKAQHIVAESTTVTGSIGVIAGRLITGRFQQELLGVSHDTILRGANADYFSSLEPFDPAQRERFASMMFSVYDTFLDHVAAGRGMERSAVAAVAEGRVWTGQRALGLGLVDELGGLDTARRAAAEAAGLDVESTRLVLYPKPPSLFDYFTSGGGSGLLAEWLRSQLKLDFAVPAQLEVAPETARLSHPF